MTSVPRIDGDLSERPSPPRRLRVADLHQGKVVQHAQGPLGHPLCPLAQAGPGVRVGHGGTPGGGVAPDNLAPPRQPGQQGRGPHPHEIGQRRGR